MENTSVRRRSVLVIGNEESQPQRVVSSMLESFLDMRGSEVAEAAPSQTDKALVSRKHSLAQCNRRPAVTQRHSVLVNSADGVCTTFNLSAVTQNGADCNGSSSPTRRASTGSRPVAPHSDVVIVSFSVHCRESFEAARGILARAVKRNVARLAGNRNTQTQFVLLGHHSKINDATDDLLSLNNWDDADWAPSLWQQRDIHSEEGEQLASEQPNCTYHELCSDSACSLQDCNPTASLICDDMIAAATSGAERKLAAKIVSKEKALKRWLKSSLRPRCVTKEDEEDGEEEEETVETASIASDQTGSMRWWDETASEGACSQWSKLADASDNSPFGTPCSSVASSPIRAGHQYSASTSSSTLSASPLCFVMESF
eukprot:scpid82460/ scgid6811/ 